MFQYRCGIKLKSTIVNAGALKILRKTFPNLSLAELRTKIQTHDYIYLSDMEKFQADGERTLAKMLHEFDQAGIETELFSEHRDTPGPWKTEPLSREVLYNMIGMSREIERQTLEDIELETEGVICPEAVASISEHMQEVEYEDKRNGVT